MRPRNGEAPIDKATMAAVGPSEVPTISRAARRRKRATDFAFLKEVSHTIWSGTVDNWHEGDHLAKASAHQGSISPNSTPG